jgi:hypothetical protein
VTLARPGDFRPKEFQLVKLADDGASVFRLKTCRLRFALLTAFSKLADFV